MFEGGLMYETASQEKVTWMIIGSVIAMALWWNRPNAYARFHSNEEDMFSISLISICERNLRF